VTDRIMAMQTFVRIVDTNSFTRAAQSLGIPRATATTLVQSLEAMLGIQLLVRTTRRLNLTAEGAAYYERCVQILADIDDIEASLRHPDDRPRGRLRVEMPAVVANAIIFPALDDFHARHEHILLAFGVSNRQLDLVGEAIDCCILIGALPGSGLAARRLGALERVTCASPLYLARYGTPLQFDELTDHVAVNCMRADRARGGLRFSGQRRYGQRAARGLRAGQRRKCVSRMWAARIRAYPAAAGACTALPRLWAAA
jgi:LysR family transcriptional regulator, regulator for bpeEF and oprC